MDNSIKRKINQNYKYNFGLSELSSTSSDYISKSNYIKKTIKQNGGNGCSCGDLFKSLKNKNFELILYILKENNCCFMCQDSNGNTGMHLLIPFYESNKEIAAMVDDILLNNDCEEFINIQNNEGKTPMFLAVLNDLDELAEKMEKAGANPEIKDLEGNYVGEKSNSSNDNINLIVTEEIPESNIKKNIMNIFNFIMPKSETSNNLTSLNLNDNSEVVSEVNSEVNSEDKSLDTDNFMNEIKSKINRSIGRNNDDSSSSSSEYKTFPKTNLKQTSSDTLNSDKFFALLGRDNKPMGIVNYSDNMDDTEQFIATLRNKYNVISETDKSLKKPKSSRPPRPQINNSDTLASILNSTDTDEISLKHTQPLSSETSLDESISESKIKKLIDETTSDDLIKSDMKQKPKLESETSSNIIDTDMEKYINETTSDGPMGNKSKSKYSVFLKEKNFETTEIDTDTLLDAIKKIQVNNITDSEQLVDLVGGGSKINKQITMGYRKLISNTFETNDLKKKKSNRLLNSDDYNELYNSDGEFGSKLKKSNNELSRMITSQKEKIHKEVLEMIMGMLNKGLLNISNKPIEASERNAKLIKAYIYRQISEKNPQMGGMDKIMVLKTMSENEIINMVKKMPELDELEKSIQKHLEDKKSSKKSIDISETSEDSEKPKKSSKKSSKK